MVIGHASDGGDSGSSSLSSSRGPTNFGIDLPVVAASISGISVNSNLVDGKPPLSRKRRGQPTDRDSAGAPATVANAELTKGSMENTSTPAVYDSNGVLQEQQPTSNYPYVDQAASPNVTALLGKTAYLNCQVKNLGDKTVSWVRHRDIHLLTVGRYTYTTDQRFRAIHVPNTDDYTLMIKYPQHRDSGIYECQISTTPHLSHYVHLGVVEPVTEVIGGPDLFIDRGSTINLTCTVKHSPEPPSYIIWNHNNAIISYNSPRGGVSVLTEKGPTTTSYLLIQQAKPTDSGRYSCNPSNAVPHSIVVHVLNGELPAAMHTGGQATPEVWLPLIFLSTDMLVLLFLASLNECDSDK
ncbi:Lachesin [Orchesella cincta]|uniref:Lachesin n=1 Tax=Orchesella cincta TaxID=48709 RepID=A0A1D2MKW9_ORCCI|nr:Lachesin [Orchesella cincta]